MARCNVDEMGIFGLKLPRVFCHGVILLTQAGKSDLRSFLEDSKEQHHGLAEF